LYASQADHTMDSMRRFRVAARHSRRVRALRIAVPILVGLALVSIVAVSVFNPWRMLKNLPIEMGNLVVSGTKITMEAPRMAGYTPDGRAYEVSAQAAAQDITKPDQVELQQIQAKLEMQDKSQVQMTAAKGIFQTKGEILKLEDQIFLKSSTYEGRLQEAVVEMKKGTVSSDKPVTLKWLDGDLEAQSLRIVDSGAVIRFDGGVSMTVKLKAQTPAAQDSQEQAAQ
jgi:lipopolysaccharide export system protein LptC